MAKRPRKGTFEFALHKLLDCRCTKCKGTGAKNWVERIEKPSRRKKPCTFCNGTGFINGEPVYMYKVHIDGGCIDIT